MNDERIAGPSSFYMAVSLWTYHLPSGGRIARIARFLSLKKKFIHSLHKPDNEITESITADFQSDFTLDLT